MSKQDKQAVVAPSAVVAAGLASATAAVVTSKFGVAGTIGGAALTSMIANGGSAIYRAYIERASSRIKDIPSSVQIRTGIGGEDRVPEADSPPGRPDLRNNVPGRFRAALGWFPTLPLPRRRSILIGALIAGALSLLLSLGAVTGIELGVGKSLSCWVWNNCPTETSADGGKVSNVSTLPSIFGGGQSAGSATPQAQPSSPQQRPVPGAPGSPSQTPNAAPSGSPSQAPNAAPSGSPSQAPNAAPGSEQPAPSTPDQQSSPSGNPSGTPKNQLQENPPQENQSQPSPSGDSSKDQQRGNQGSVPPAGS